MSDAGRHSRLGVPALLAAAALWSLNGPLIKLLTQASADGAAGLSGLQIACYRSLLGGILFLPLALRRLDTLRRVKPIWPIASIVSFTLMTAAFVSATALGKAANAIALQYISPVVVFLLSPLVLGERPRWSEGAALVLAVVGVGVIFAGSEMAEAPILLLGLASGVGYGLLTLVLRALRTVDAFLVVTLNALGSGVALLAVVLIGAALTGGGVDISVPQFGLLVLMSVVQFCGPYVLFSWALRHVPAHRAAMIVLLEMVLNPLFTWLGAGEAPSGATLIGGPLILIGVAAQIMLRRPGRPEPARAARPDAPPPRE